jgi:uncharacterized protein YdiU (UPF0061 family)
MIVLNAALAIRLGLSPETLASNIGIAELCGSQLPDGADPIAQAYAGHQFGHFTMLGDGRAILLGEHVDPEGQRWDVQLKGAGPTAFARGGDGFAALGPMLREFLISEAMHGMGIPTTRSLAVIATGEMIQREEQLPGAVLCRVAASHVRVGTFEYAANLVGPQAVQALADHVIQRHHPDLSAQYPSDRSQGYRELFSRVAQQQAKLLAQWMGVGFVHGVMNTDNMAVSGETIDYGPCAFMDAFDPGTVFSSIDRFGRYAYDQQPRIAQWNLARLAEAMLTLFDDKPGSAVDWANHAIESFSDHFQHQWRGVMQRKLGLMQLEEHDLELMEELLRLMREYKADFTSTFRTLSQADVLPTRPDSTLFAAKDGRGWHARWLRRIQQQDGGAVTARASMRKSNPAYIPRNHRVEESLRSAIVGDLRPLYRLWSVLRSPYEEHPGHDDLRLPPPPESLPYRTFCGT